MGRWIMGRWIMVIYGVVAYGVGLAGLVFFALFVGSSDLPWLGTILPVDINPVDISPVDISPVSTGLMDDKMAGVGPVGGAIAINTGLIVLFGLQHSVMARRGFKQWWRRVLPEAIARSTYVLLSGLMMILIGIVWHPLPGTLWQIDQPALRWGLLAVQWSGWGLTAAASFMINHFELFGLQQVYYQLMRQPEPPAQFTERSLYKQVRHPIQLGLLMGLWVAPTMTVSRALLAVLLTAYIVIGLFYEEKDLVATLGPLYQDYQRRVPKLLPLGLLGRRNTN